jgi:nicotinamide-nucleotide amidase
MHDGPTRHRPIVLPRLRSSVPKGKVMKIQPPTIIDMERDTLPILQAITETLRLSLRTLAVAEDAITAGLLAASLTATCDATVLRRGWLLQDRQSKIEEVGVQRATIELHGETSEAVAVEMAHGARRNSGCTYGLAICGSIQTRANGAAVGHVWIAISHGTTVSTMQQELHGDRYDMAQSAVNACIELLQEAIRYF